MILRLFAACFGAFLGLALLKFGSVPIMEKWVTTPTEFFEALVSSPWPIRWAYVLLCVVGLVGLAALLASVVTGRRGTKASWWPLLLPLPWLFWQGLASAYSVDANQSSATMGHFVACVVCFYFGFMGLRQGEHTWPFWLGLLIGFLLVVASGLDQHFGGLEESRRYFWNQMYLYPERLKETPIELLKRMASSRIYSTLFYPNGLAGGVLLLLPGMLGAAGLLQSLLRQRFGSRLTVISTLAGLVAVCIYLYLLNSKVGWVWVVLLGLSAIFPAPSWSLTTILAAGGVACLYWTRSKGGWLLAMMLGVVFLLRLPIKRTSQIGVVCALLLAGLAGFFWKYASFFEKGATSVSARFDYWLAALQTTRKHPLFGTGPGTFAQAYEKVRRQGSEPTRLVHNDYLEQASDSGIMGMLAYAGFIITALIRGFPRGRGGDGPFPRDLEADSNSRGRAVPAPDLKGASSGIWAPWPEEWLAFLVWLGVFGWALQSCLEFSLYISALAWPAFTFLGWLLARRSHE